MSHETTMLIIKQLKRDLGPLLTSKRKLFATIFVLDLTLITDIFASRSWILMDLKSIFPLHRNRLINSNDKKDGWLYDMGIY